MHAPGALEELPPAGLREWEAALERAVHPAGRSDLGRDGAALPGEDLGRAPEHRTLDWPALPVYLCACLGTADALELLDWQGAGVGALGRVRHQDEYLEWRVVRQGGRMTAVEMTTELPEYWETLAAHAPERTLELVREFANGVGVSYEDIYGSVDPLDPGSTPEQRRRAFTTIMLARDSDPFTEPPASSFNNGTAAMCCMIHRSNTLSALTGLIAGTSNPYIVRDQVTQRSRFPTGGEAIVAAGAAGKVRRNSDPLIAERVSRFSTERRQVALDDPAGVYIRSFQHHELVQPDGETVPQDWFKLSRGWAHTEAPDGRARHQRLTFRLPSDADFAMNDIVVRRTGQKLRYGGQLAALVQVSVHLRTGRSPGVASLEPQDPPAVQLTCTKDVQCGVNHQSWEGYLAEGGRPIAGDAT